MTNFVTLGKSFNQSEPQLLICEVRIIVIDLISPECWWDCKSKTLYMKILCTLPPLRDPYPTEDNITLLGGFRSLSGADEVVAQLLFFFPETFVDGIELEQTYDL